MTVHDVCYISSINFAVIGRYVSHYLVAIAAESFAYIL